MSRTTIGTSLQAAVRDVFEPLGVPREHCDELSAQAVLGLLDVDPSATPGAPLSAELLAERVVEELDADYQSFVGKTEFGEGIGMVDVDVLICDACEATNRPGAKKCVRCGLDGNVPAVTT